MKIMSFDFRTKTEQALDWEDLPDQPERELFYWIEMDAADESLAADLLSRFSVNTEVTGEFLGQDREGRHDVYDDCLHFGLTEALIQEDGRLEASHIDILLSTSCMIMWHRKSLRFIEKMRRTVREDFKRFAKTPGFLIYELADHLIESYRQTVSRYADEVERVQLNLFGKVDDEIFRHVSDLTSDLLALKRIVQASRELIHQLASRRSPFVSESTQGYLNTMAETLKRMSDDLTSEREVLSETLNLYMGMVSHRTNRIINRLTVISMIFLPLTFMCGIYGMNFDVMPELRWAFSYAAFWVVTIVFTGTSICLMRKKKWL